jgi:hypothetical protein
MQLLEVPGVMFLGGDTIGFKIRPGQVTPSVFEPTFLDQEGGTGPGKTQLVASSCCLLWCGSSFMERAAHAALLGVSSQVHLLALSVISWTSPLTPNQCVQLLAGPSTCMSGRHLKPHRPTVVLVSTSPQLSQCQVNGNFILLAAQVDQLRSHSAPLSTSLST